MDVFAVKVDGSDVIAGISLYENLLTDSRYDITSVNFNSEKVDHEDDIFVRQDMLHLGFITYIFTTLKFPTHNFDFHLLTTSVNAKYY